VTTTPNILLVEDNDDDAELTELAFKRAQIQSHIVRAKDGFEALDYLRGRGAHRDRDPRDLPAVILLDLNLPRMRGLEVLKAIREDARAKLVPVVILSSSDEENDRVGAYGNHANSYVRKPVDHGDFSRAVQSLGLYWLAVNLPPHSSATSLAFSR
jgi:two-component system response regulator